MLITFALTIAAAAALAASPEVRTNKVTYAPGEPIEVLFEGAPGNHLDWITIVQKTPSGEYKPPDGPRQSAFSAPDKQWKPWAQLKRVQAGSHVFKGLEEGEYEVQLLRRRTNREIGEVVARSTFVVGAQHASAQLAVQDLLGGDRTEMAASDTGAASPAAAGFKIALPEPGIAGSWLGHITCIVRETRKGDVTSTANAILHISEQGPLQAELFILWPSNQGSALRLAGEHEGASGSVSFAAREWIYPPRGADHHPVNLNATVDSTGLRMRGEILNAAGCSEFQAIKYMRDDRAPHERGLVSGWEKYKYALAHEGTCVPFLRWTTEGDLVQTQE